MANKQSSDGYGADSIRVLEGLEAVRKRPGMYIGDTAERGLHHLVTEIVETRSMRRWPGYCTEINVVILSDDRISVEDNGRGIPVDMHPTEKRSALEVVHTVLHAGGKFDRGAYKVSGGLHGVGASVVNALSEEFEVEVRKNGKVYFQRYERGAPQDQGRGARRDQNHRHQDHLLARRDDFHRGQIQVRKDRALPARDGVSERRPQDPPQGRARPAKKRSSTTKAGSRSSSSRSRKGSEALHDVIFFKGMREGIDVEVALQWTDAVHETIFTYANNIQRWKAERICRASSRR